MTDHSDLIAELRSIAEYVCWDKFEDRFISDPKKHPAWRAADALSSQSLALSEAREEIERLKGLLRMERGARLETAADLSNETEACASICDEWAHPPTMRLHAGEMTGAEIRSVRAVLAGVADAIRNRSKAREGRS